MFWKDSTEPLRKNRWKIEFSGTNFGVDAQNSAYLLKKCDKPSYKLSDIQHKFGNYVWNYPGRVEWNPINITFASISTLSNQLMTILKKAGFKPPNSVQSALGAATKAEFVNQMGSIKIIQLASDGTSPLETWELVNPFFTNIKFGDLSYDSEEIVDLECTIRYDTANLTQQDKIKEK